MRIHRRKSRGWKEKINRMHLIQAIMNNERMDWEFIESHRKIMIFSGVVQMWSKLENRKIFPLELFLLVSSLEKLKEKKKIICFDIESISAIRVNCLTPCAVEKRTATLVCEANGMPTPEYSWSYGQVCYGNSMKLYKNKNDQFLL